MKRDGMSVAMKRVGIIGWRGMVGSVLLERMEAEGDFDCIEPCFFTTSQQGQAAPRNGAPALIDASDLDRLEDLEVILSCQGGDYTTKVHPALRARGWSGYWIDAASTLRMEESACIVLDPINRQVIDRALDRGCRDLVGGNCTVSLMLMAFGPLLQRGWVEWMSTMTYQAASGAGAAALRELCQQLRVVGEAAGESLDDPASGPLDLDRRVGEVLRSPELPTATLGAPLAGSLIPWIDRDMGDGSTREEWKGFVETNKILALDPPVPVDGVCVRVASLRCHSQAVTIKLRSSVPLDEIEQALRTAHQWVQWIDNEPEGTRARLSPSAVSGRLEVAVGRLRKMRMGDDFLTAFTVGDQLLWGAAEPLRRALRIVLERDGEGIERFGPPAPSARNEPATVA